MSHNPANLFGPFLQLEKLPKLACRVGRDSPAQIDLDIFSTRKKLPKMHAGGGDTNLGNVLLRRVVFGIPSLMEVVLVMWIFQQAFLYKGPPKLSGPKYTDHTHYSLEKYSFYPWIIFLGTNPRWSFNLISLAAERKNSIIIFLFWNHIFWTNLNKYAIVARRKEKKLWKKFARVCDRMNT